MKIRNGFVSNSSSSSFVIRGIKIKKYDLASAWGLNTQKPEKKESAYDKSMKQFREDEEDDEIECAKEDDDDNFDSDLWDEIYSKAGKFKLEIEDMRDFFDGEEAKDCIVGISVGELDDGVVMELKDDYDNKGIVEKLEKSGLKVKQKDLKTYIQYVSNDNY